VNIIRGKRERAGAVRADGAGGGTPGRRSVLGGLAALPVLYGVGSATRALAGPAARPGSIPAAAGDLVRGAERRYNAPLLRPEHPYRDRFYALALQPMSRNPYPRSTTIG
jgi:hypothetical protein